MKRVVTLVFCLLLIFAAGCVTEADDAGSSDQGTSEAPTPVATYKASELATLFDNDEDEAKDLVGKVVQVTGAVTDVDDDEIKLDQEIKYAFYMCEISENDTADYSSIEKGDVATIVGTIKRELGNIEMVDCWYVGKGESGALIESIEFSDDYNYQFSEIGDIKKGWIIVNTDAFTEDDFEIVLVNPEVASVTWGTKTNNFLWFTIEATASGRTGFLVQTKDGSVQSRTKSLVVDRQ